MSGDRAALHDRIRSMILGAATDPTDIETLALDLFAWQRVYNPVYGALAADAEPRRVTEIPTVPVNLFQDLDLACFPIAADTPVFRTSGTTGARRGRHFHLDTALYDLAAPRFFREIVGNVPNRVISLCPHEPDSSLGHMVERLGTEVVHAFDARTGVNPEVWSHLQSGPVFLAATAFALDALFALPGVARLDERSLVMVTGGFKGRAVRMDAPALYAEIPARLGTPRVVGEYGMTELSSQLWTVPVPAGSMPGPFLAPPWLRVWAADPDNGAPVPGVGVLRFVDLLNVWSVVGVETMDLGEVRPGRPGDEVTLVGRASGAELRGCSLRAEDFLRRV